MINFIIVLTKNIKTNFSKNDTASLSIKIWNTRFTSCNLLFSRWRHDDVIQKKQKNNWIWPNKATTVYFQLHEFFIIFVTFLTLFLYLLYNYPFAKMLGKLYAETFFELFRHFPKYFPYSLMVLNNCRLQTVLKLKRFRSCARYLLYNILRLRNLYYIIKLYILYIYIIITWSIIKKCSFIPTSTSVSILPNILATPTHFVGQS